ncbi:MAG TPA: AAA family ATPase, partial [Myxococcus sp.]|nr:AAA family ATPase [Myxococcus sp.]
MHTIPGYSLTEVLLETPDSVLLRGRKGPQAVLLRTPVKEFPTPEELAHLRYDGAICASLEERGGVRVLGLEKHGNSLALVAEDFGATPLRKLLVPTGMPLAEALAIARELARAVGEVHGCQVIHMAIEPSHVLVNLASHQVRLCGFGAASRLHRESPTSARLDAPEGLLAYVSPEQTGRMNRAVDYRTDLYSLGVTLYEMLTGQLPFSGRDALAMVHAHIATVPHPPHHLRPEIPPAVSSVVLKLLAKNAEDRYQSAFGLMVDLESCLEQLAATGTVTDFPPGRRDVSARFQIPQKLYGREREQAALLAAFERASRGSTELLLVTGYSGIGKSSLVNEIHKPLARQRSFFCSGKFDQLRSTPYGALIQAFQGLIRQLLTEREERVASWRALLSAALGANAQVVIDVIPELALILGPQPPVPALGPTESQSRFNIVFQQFMAVFTREEHPLTLFLDDLQWADAASLRFIQMLLADPKSRHLLVIGAYRNNEVRSGHPLMLALGEIRKGPLAVSELSLGPLVLDDVRTLLAETLACPDEADVHALAALVFEKTQGNPFFISQFLGSLYTRDLISFDAARGRWRWSMERIHQVGISDDVARLMAERLQELSPPVQRSLQLAACIGGTFSIEWLAVVDERSVPQMAAGLWEA